MHTTDSSGAITGRVIEGDGAPVVGAGVSVLGVPDSALTAPDGRFALGRLRFGAHIVNIRRLGFAAKRFVLTIAADAAPDVTVTMTRFVPILATVTTTAAERAGYQSVGFDERMKAGVGQYLTYEQIVRKQASYFTDILRQMNGIAVHPAPDPYDDVVVGTRGLGSCGAFVVDGMPQQLIGGESPNHVIDLSEVGAGRSTAPRSDPPGSAAWKNMHQPREMTVTILTTAPPS